MVCHPVDTDEGRLNQTPCSFSLPAGVFDPDGRYWQSSTLLGIPLAIVLSKEGYRNAEVLLTDGPRSWRGRDVAGPVERTYYFVTRQRFEIELEPLADYGKITAAALKERPSEPLVRLTARDALADCKTLFLQNELSSALDACNLAISLAEGEAAADAYYLRCRTNLQLGRFQPALQDCSDFLALRRDDGSAWNAKGVILRKLGRLDEALLAFSEAIRIDSEDEHALKNRAATYADLGRYPEPLNDCEAALLVNPEDAQLLGLRLQLLDLTIARP